MRRRPSVIRMTAADLNGRTGPAYAILPEGYDSEEGRILAGGRIVRHEARLLPAIKERYLVLFPQGGDPVFLPLFDCVDTDGILTRHALRDVEPVRDTECGGVKAYRVSTDEGVFLVTPEEGSALQGHLAEQIRKKLCI